MHFSVLIWHFFAEPSFLYVSFCTLFLIIKEGQFVQLGIVGLFRSNEDDPVNPSSASIELRPSKTFLFPSLNPRREKEALERSLKFIPVQVRLPTFFVKKKILD